MAEQAATSTQPATTVQVDHEVIGAIAAIAASQVDGVVGFSPGLVGNLGEMLGRRSATRGVRVERAGQEMTLSLYLVIAYGSRIPEVAQRVQERVKRMVEAMTGLRVTEVAIHIQGVSFATRPRNAASSPATGNGS
ncbi:MAG: Asp23/Gls24 family envelope stress response protein [Firmicutes bacterium]|nr:Asp23/Gls24 family envelope stress response protein [Bacillota bacterium]